MSEERWSVPDTWSWAPVGDIAEVVGGGTPPAKDPDNFCSDGIAWLTPADLTGYDAVYISKGARDLTDQGLAKSSAKLMPAGAVLYSSRAPIGYCAIAANEISTNQGFKSLVLPDGVSPEFTRLYLLASKDYAESKASGTTFKEVSGARVKQFPIPLPPLAEQRRIVAKLDQLSARTRAAKDHLARVQTLATRAKQATLATLIDGQDLSLERRPVGDVIATLDQGWSPKCKSDPVGDDTSWGVIKTTSIQAFDFHAGANKALPSDLEPRPQLSIDAGDVLITRAGPRVRVGVTCYVEEAYPTLMICDKVYRLRVDPAAADPMYLTAVLNSPASLDQLESLKTGGNDSGLNLTQKRFLNLMAPFPSLDEQTEIVRRIEAAFARIDRMVAEAAKALALLERLEQQLLAKAFRGELVPQDPNDEPASALLARIREARTNAPKPKRTRKKTKT